MFKSYRPRPLANPYYPKFDRRPSKKKLYFIIFLSILLAAGGLFAGNYFLKKNRVEPNTEVIVPSPVAVWQSADKSIYLDKYGNFFNELTADEKAEEFPHLIDESQSDISDIRNPISSINLNRILELKKTFDEKVGTNLNGVIFPNRESSWIKAVTAEGWLVYFDLNSDLQGQLNKLLAVLSNIGEKRKKIDYIDVRFTDRVYYK